jgi:hypothetical protein
MKKRKKRKERKKWEERGREMDTCPRVSRAHIENGQKSGASRAHLSNNGNPRS